MAAITPMNRIFSKRLLVLHAPARSAGVHAFTLLEFVLVAAVSGIVLMVAAWLSVNETRSNIRTYVYQSLRDQMARVTFLIEGEVAEASDLSSIEPSACKTASNASQGPLGGVFLFSFVHKYTQSQLASDATICYYNDASTPGSLYRYGPTFDDRTGVLQADPSSLRLVSKNTALTTISVDQDLLRYNIKIGIDSSGDGSIWNLSYAPTSSQVARVGTACMPSSSTTSTGCW